jgi:hypothetical protein
MEAYLCQNGILFKNCSDRVKDIGERLKRETLEPLKSQGVPVVPCATQRSAKTRWRRVRPCHVLCFVWLEPSPA